jgi:hypothetical protein
MRSKMNKVDGRIWNLLRDIGESNDESLPADIVKACAKKVPSSITFLEKLGDDQMVLKSAIALGGSITMTAYDIAGTPEKKKTLIELMSNPSLINFVFSVIPIILAMAEEAEESDHDQT